jgi:hypothetical protein
MAPDINDLSGMHAATPPNVLRALAQTLGIAQGERGTWRCPDPAHDDQHPSASIQPSRRHAGGILICGVCSKPNDAIDLIRYGKGLDFLDARKWLVRWLADEAPPPACPPPASPLRVDLVELAMCRARNAERLATAFFADKGLDVDPAWAVAAWNLGELGDLLWLPYFGTPGEEKGGSAADRVPGIVGATKRWKVADGSWGKKAERGSQRRDVFYGEWRDAGRRTVVICEGESDALALSWWLREKRVDVLGACGASQVLTRRMVRRLAGRRVVLLPDGDDAGQAWARRWRAAALAQAPRTAVAVARLPHGADACVVGRRRTLVALRQAVRA